MRKFLHALIWPIVALAAVIVWALTGSCKWLINMVNKITKE